MQKKVLAIVEQLNVLDDDVSKSLKNLKLTLSPCPDWSDSDADLSNLEFNAEKDEEEVLKNSFSIISKGVSNKIQIRQLLKAAYDDGQNPYFHALVEATKSKTPGDEITFDEFKSYVCKMPRATAQRVKWAGLLGFDNAFAKYLKAGTVFDELQGVRDMSECELRDACRRFSERELIPLVISAHSKLKSSGSLSHPAEEVNAKFNSSADAFHGKFASLKDYYEGLEGLIGHPNPQLFEGMRREHQVRPGAHRAFVAPSYQLCTRPAWEWLWVMDPAAAGPPPDPLGARLACAAGRYPGEIGDEFALRKLFVSLLVPPAATPADVAKGVLAELSAVVVAAAAASNSPDCEEWVARGVVLACPPHAAEAAAAAAARMELTVRLPWPAAATHAPGLPELRRAVSRAAAAAFTSTRGPAGEERDSALEEAAAEGVVVKEDGEARWTYCDFHEPHELSESLGALTAPQLQAWAAAAAAAAGLELPHGAGGKGGKAGGRQAPGDPTLWELLPPALEVARAALHGTAATSVAAKGADGGAAAALAQLASLLHGAETGGARAALVAALAAEHAAQTQRWAAAGQARRQGRRREGGHAAVMRGAAGHRANGAGLGPEEVAGLRLYTGPMYMLYNAVLRGFPTALLELLAGGGGGGGEANRFESTIFAMCSGVSKLARHTRVPVGRTLYRGLSGMLLPPQFWEAGADGLRGGVELGLMSTTASREVAVCYSGLHVRRGTVLEIAAGRVDIGASIKFLSQYPGEDEYLMAPLSCLEVLGEPRVENTPSGELLVFSLRVNVNNKSLTVDQLVSRRKNLHMAMIKQTREDFFYTSKDVIEEFLASFESRSKGSMELVRGLSSQVEFDNEQIKFPKNRDYATFGAPYMATSSGNMYYEIEVDCIEDDLMAGFAGTNLQPVLHRPQGFAESLGLDSLSWSVRAMTGDGGFKATILKFGMQKWNQSGTVLGMWRDSAGAFRVTTSGEFCAPTGGTVVQSGLQAGVAGSGVFPALSGRRCEVRVNLGQRPFRFLPPGFQSSWAPMNAYRSQKAAKDDNGLSTCSEEEAANILSELGMDSVSLVKILDKLRDEHQKISHEKFNDDEFNKEKMNQVLDLKMQLLNKLRAVVGLWLAGANRTQIAACTKGVLSEFKSGWSIDEECGFTWRSLLQGWIKDPMEIPLRLPPTLSALVWESVLVPSGPTQVNFGGLLVSTEKIKTTLCLRDLGLLVPKFGCAVVGLVLACCETLTELDVRGNQFLEKDAEALVVAAAECCAIRRLNGRCVDPGCPPLIRSGIVAGSCLPLSTFQGISFPGANDQESRASSCIRSAKTGHEISNFERTKAEEWAYIMSRMETFRWKFLDFRRCCVSDEGATGMGLGLAMLTDMRTIHLGENQIYHSGGAAIGSSLATLTNLTLLNLSDNRFGAAGGQAVGNSLKTLANLKTFNFLRNECGSLGATAIGSALLALTCLEMLDLRCNNMGKEGGEAVAAHLSRLECLKTLCLGGNQFGPAIASVGRSIAPLTALKDLDLNENDVDDEGGQVLAAGLLYLSGLEQLKLCQNKMGGAGASAVGLALAGLGNLRELDLGDLRLHAEGGMAVGEVLSILSKLKILYLSGGSMGPVGSAAAVANLGMLTDLVELDLGNNQMGPQGGAVVGRSLSKLTGLVLLGLAQNDLGTEGGNLVGQSLACLTNLRSLYFGANCLGSEGGIAVGTSLAKLSCVTLLDLRKNQLEGEGGKAVAEGLVGMGANLSIVDLSDNKFGVDCRLTLAKGLTSMKALQTLSIRENSLGPEGAVAVAEALKSVTTLEKLDMRYNRYNAIGWETLRKVSEIVDELPMLHNLMLED